jgi:hypothetical protein
MLSKQKEREIEKGHTGEMEGTEMKDDQEGKQKERHTLGNLEEKERERK